jgi:glycerol-3-phosphate acyltransferase PlsY
MKFTFLIILAYLLGSIPFSLIIAKSHGKDLRKIGSGNLGSTNLARAAGKKWAYVCFALDVSKGFFPMLTASNIVSSPPQISELLLTLAVGIAAVLGHIFPIYLKFKGGKGAATSLGVALGLWPYYTICAVIAFAAWIVFVLVFRYVSLASMAGAVSFLITLIILISLLEPWKFSQLWPLLIAAAGIMIMIIIRHRSNIKRILDGTEGKIFQK